MNKKTIDNIHKWILRFRYFRILVLGASLISFGLTLLFSNFSLINKPDFDIFIIVISIILGIAFCLIGLYSRLETEIGIKENNNKKHL